MRQILNSWDLNDEVYDIALNNCLYKHNDLIKYYWHHNFNHNIKYSFYKDNKINKHSIMEALMK